MPLYQDITDKLIEELDHGVFGQGDRFYSEAEICSKFKVSSTTAVKVLNALQEANRVTRIQGRGTFVAAENHRRVVMYTDLNMSENQSEHVELLSAEFKREPAMLQTLGLTREDRYCELRRLRFIGSQVSQYSINYVNAKFLPDDVDAKFDQSQSVYQLIKATTNLDPYQLPFAQRNTAVKTATTPVAGAFSESADSDIVINQQRKVFLPYANHELLEYAVSYKLPQFWGFQTDSVFGEPDHVSF
ncbi:GntR family transcriptional regulator [Lacticaseibacillus sharpeae]|uniref:HTH gntR-type domain-containing protein n=1 Tax=Lacticaseibacillus sharpeae JCM 1186 = DSM 20505 TaxID=1291052 RepID=A0A0R1ZKJ3_9LACO|nr:GntR family transcriptional regulator [Lacticaseibacillus sharpeae]KRM54866.1 hypothetical protein FC18_GL001908 [Lacticaseibacillus sharpeae JCM 1186 = DSM 20505]